MHEVRQATYKNYLYRFLLMALILWGVAPFVNAAKGSGQFGVAATLQTTSSTSLCRNVNPPGAFGATVIVVCSTDAVVHISPGINGSTWSPLHGGAGRNILFSSTRGIQIGAAGSYDGIGTVASWRVVQIANWNYLEMLMSW